MITSLQLYIAIAAIVASFSLGFYTCHKFNLAAQDKADQAIIAEQQKNAQLLGQISETYEKGRQTVLASQLSSTIALSKPNASYSHCIVVARDRRLLQTAVSQANSAK